MKMKLQYLSEPSGTPVLDLVTPKEPREAFIVNYVRWELGSYGVAEELRSRVVDIMAGTRPPSEGGVEDHWQAFNLKTATIARSFAEIPDPEPEVTDVTMPIEDFVDVLDQWIAFMKAYPYTTPVIR